MTAYPFVRAALARLNLFRRLHALEGRMDQTDIALADLNDATNEVAAELEGALTKLDQLDSATADKVRAAANRLRGLAVDPENPVPAPENPPAESNSDPEPSGSSDSTEQESTSGDEQQGNTQL